MSTEKDTWEQVMALKSKDTRSVGLANNLTDDEVTTIIATIDFFGGDYRQDIFDLHKARYRVFDWLAMRIQGRRAEEHTTPTQVLAYSFIKSGGDVDKFIEDLRVTDYDIDDSYKTLKV